MRDEKVGVGDGNYVLRDNGLIEVKVSVFEREFDSEHHRESSWSCK